MSRTVWLIILVILAAWAVVIAFGQPMPVNTPPQPTVIIAWDPVHDPIVAGYHAYYGYGNGPRTNQIDCGLTPSVSIYGLPDGQYYSMGATTYTLAGAESEMSGPIWFTNYHYSESNRVLYFYLNGASFKSITNLFGDHYFCVSNSQLVDLRSVSQRYYSGKPGTAKLSESLTIQYSRTP